MKSIDINVNRHPNRWYTEHTALLVSTLKWSLLGAAAGTCVGAGTRGFLWALAHSTMSVRELTGGAFPPFLLLPLALPLCVWLVRTFAPDARGHGTEAVIEAVHEKSGRIDWRVAPVKLGATVLTLAFGGSVGKEGPAAQIGAALTSLFADVFRLSDADRRRLVICGISAGFAAVFGTPVSGALFGIEVLYLGRIDYALLFPALVAGIFAHLVCGVRAPFPPMHEMLGTTTQVQSIVIAVVAGLAFGLIALLLIEAQRGLNRMITGVAHHPYAVAAGGGVILVLFYFAVGDTYSGLGTDTITGILGGTAQVVGAAFALKIFATVITLEVGGSGGIVTPIFFVGATSGAMLASLSGLPTTTMAAYGFVALLAAAANTPIAAAVMAIELLPPGDGVYAVLAAMTAFLMVGHRSVYASQKLGMSKSAALDFTLGTAIGDMDRSAVRLRKGSIAERLHRGAFRNVRTGVKDDEG